jgi:hypothetical protein
MWVALKEIAKRESCRIHDLCTLISARKNVNTSLTAAIRVFLMLYYRAAATEEGHGRAGHGNFETMLRRAQISPEAVSTMIRRPHGNGKAPAGSGYIRPRHPSRPMAAAPGLLPYSGAERL